MIHRFCKTFINGKFMGAEVRCNCEKKGIRVGQEVSWRAEEGEEWKLGRVVFVDLSQIWVEDVK